MSDLNSVLDVFAPTFTSSRVPTLEPTIKESLTCQMLAPDASLESKRGLILLLMVVGSSEVTRVSLWKNYLLTYTFAVFEKLARDPDVQGNVTFQYISKANEHHLKQLFEASKEARKNLAKQAKWAEYAAEIYNVLFDEYGSPSDFIHLMDSLDVRVAYAHYSLVVYLAGKVISDLNKNSIEVARPRAVISKYRMGQGGTETVSTLNGVYMLSREAHDGINRAWLEMTSFRVPVLTAIITACQSGRDIALDVMNTTIALMAFSQMSHAIFCRDLVVSEGKWLETWPPVASSINTFKISCQALKNVDAPIRAFVKVIYGDKAKFFPRRDMMPLIECAIADKKASGGTMGSYFSDPSYTQIVDAYRIRRSQIKAGNDSATPSFAPRPLGPAPPITQEEAHDQENSLQPIPEDDEDQERAYEDARSVQGADHGFLPVSSSFEPSASGVLAAYDTAYDASTADNFGPIEPSESLIPTPITAKKTQPAVASSSGVSDVSPPVLAEATRRRRSVPKPAPLTTPSKSGSKGKDREPTPPSSANKLLSLGGLFSSKPA